MATIPVEVFHLSRDAQGTLHARIQQMVAQGILSGRFARGEKLPSTRALARHLGVSRITVSAAYTELVANDYLSARGRSGYYVSDEAPEPPRFAPPRPQAGSVDWQQKLTQRYADGPAFDMGRPADWARYPYPFVYGQVDPTLFDHANWRLCAMQALGARDFNALTQDQFDADDPELVEFIARQTLPRRGIHVHPDEILITLGAQNALWLATQLLARRQKVAVEDPAYPTTRRLLHQVEAEITPIPVDADGLPPDAIPQGTRVIYTTPSHQCPTSTTLPMARRTALLDRAAALDALVIEDDYEFEMAYLKPPSPALKSLDDAGRVIYVGSFSKSLFPGLRLGYLVGAAPFIREARALRASVLRHPPGHTQRTVARFLSLGHYDTLVRRIGRALADRRAEIERAANAHGLTIAGMAPHGGSALWMRGPDGCDMAQVAQTLRAQGVLIEPGQPFFAGPEAPRHHYRLGYSSIARDRIAEGIARIAGAF